MAVRCAVVQPTFQRCYILVVKLCYLVLLLMCSVSLVGLLVYLGAVLLDIRLCFAIVLALCRIYIVIVLYMLYSIKQFCRDLCILLSYCFILFLLGAFCSIRFLACQQFFRFVLGIFLQLLFWDNIFMLWEALLLLGKLKQFENNCNFTCVVNITYISLTYQTETSYLLNEV